MEITTEPVPMYDPTADVDNQFGSDNLAIAQEREASITVAASDQTADVEDNKIIVAQETTDTFDNASQLPTREYYKRQVDNLHSTGALEEYNQQPIDQATLDYITASSKDPVSLLSIYCMISGHPVFQFYDYQVERRPDKNKFIMVSELDGQPVFGALQPSKKDAKKACAVRIIEQLMAKQRLNCLNDRKHKHQDKRSRRSNAHAPQVQPQLVFPIQPQPLFPQNAQQEGQQSNDELGNLNANFYQHAPTDPQMAFFAEDIDFGGGGNPQTQQTAIMPMPTPLERAMLADFERANPVPPAPECKDATVFYSVRAQAFQLFCQNAFWRDFETDISPEVQEKLNQCGMWSEQWNPLQFVNKCIMRANSWRTVDKSEEQPAMEQTQQQEATASVEVEGQPDGTSSIATAAAPMVTNQEMAVEAQHKLQKNLPLYSAVFFVFTLPYNPPRYAGVALFDRKIYHGKMEVTKSRAKLSCATTLSIEIVKMGLADLEKKPKPIKKSQALARAKKRKIVSKVEEMENGAINESSSSIDTVSEHQFLLTLHPAENLDPRTHFLLAANPTKSAIQLLHEMSGKARFVVGYEEMRQMDGNHGSFTITVQLQPPGIPGLPQELTGHPFSVQGVPERNKKLAKLSAARAALDALVQRKVVGVHEQNLASFKHAIKRARLCECEDNDTDNANSMNVEEQQAKDKEQVNEVETAVSSLELAEVVTQEQDAMNAPLVDKTSD